MYSKTSKRVIALLFPVFILSMTFNVANASNLWEEFHWSKTEKPLTVTIVDKTSSEWGLSIEGAVSDWSLSDVLDVEIAKKRGSGKKNAQNCDPIEGRVVICNSEYGDTNWLGITQVWLDGDHITKATIKLNDTYFNQARFNTSEWRNYVTCHEVGHILGLDHADEDYNNSPLGTCLDLVTDPELSQHPDKSDYDSLELIYSHIDETNTDTPGKKKGGKKK